MQSSDNHTDPLTKGKFSIFERRRNIDSVEGLEDVLGAGVKDI